MGNNSIGNYKMAEGRARGGFSSSIGWLGVILVWFVVPMLIPNYVRDIVWTKFLIYALFAVSYDLIYGHGGLLSLCHAAFLGAGAYTVAVLMFHYDITSFWIVMPCAILVSAIIAAIFGALALRMSGFYFMLLTFALGQLLYSIVWNIEWFSTPGMQGISGIDWPTLGMPGFQWSETIFYLFVAIVTLVGIYLLSRVIYSHFGYALRGIRENELRMEALGYNTWLFKYLGFVVSGAFSGVAGGLFAYYSGFVCPSHVGITTSFVPMIMVIIGGSGTLIGPVIGAFIVVFLEYFVSLIMPERWPLILGILFVAIVIYTKGGVVIILEKIWRRGGKLYRERRSFKS